MCLCMLAGDDEITGVANWGTGSFVHMSYTRTTPGDMGLKFLCGSDTVFLVNPRYDKQVKHVTRSS